METYSQQDKDLFVSKLLDGKRDGYFLQIGSDDSVIINNTYSLEKNYNWSGLIVDYNEPMFEEIYKKLRPNSHYVTENAVELNYLDIFKRFNFPKDMDYLQIGLEVSDGSALNTLFNLNDSILNKYRFATIIFKHDIYKGNYCDTRNISRDIFESNGYILLFSDVRNGPCPFEDWYVHPDLVDMNYVNNLIENNKKYYVNHPITEKTLNWKDIQYI